MLNPITAWSKLANLRYSQIESGEDITFWKVFCPIFSQKLTNLPIKPSILEVGCGTGHLSREIANQGYTIEAIEPALEMIEFAKKVLLNRPVSLTHTKIENHIAQNYYNLVLSHMVVNSVDNLESFFNSIRKNLSQGEFWFTATHPLFWNNIVKWIPESEFIYHQERKANDCYLFITKDPQKPIGPIFHWHRPFDAYFSALAKTGFRVNNLIEVMPPHGVADEYDEKWRNPRFVFFICSTV